MRTPYFPAVGETPNCDVCEREGCHSRGKFQRDYRTFSYTSGRCPRLPDIHDRMEPEDAALWASLYTEAVDHA